MKNLTDNNVLQRQCSKPSQFRPAALLTLCAAIVLLSACASTPAAPEGSAEVRAKLTELRTNTQLATRAPVEIQAAELAVSAAERPRDERELERHLVLVADQQVDIAGAWAQTRLYESQRTELTARREAVRLEARTREADLARSDANSARSAADTARVQAEAARAQANSATTQANAATAQAAASRRAAEAAQTQTAVAQGQTALALGEASAARSETEELQRQLDDLNARMTDRGMVVTLGDVMFETGNSELRGGTTANLDNLVSFLKRFESRTVIIEGHTDSVGTESSNQALSQRRSDSVQGYLASNGIARSRISSVGLGENSPIADNESATGRQQNRRVEVIISNQSE
ncbi:MAG: OmpA family protein [Pseudohongiella sp.]|nr:OmpA family protein [Pseudohongiella sp.]